jgi:hypothetical protein
MPSLLAAMSDALQATHRTVAAATTAATAAGNNNQASLSSLLTEAQQAVAHAQGKLRTAKAALEAANERVGCHCITGVSAS